jgi:hypothetical protein
VKGKVQPEGVMEAAEYGVAELEAAEPEPEAGPVSVLRSSSWSWFLMLLLSLLLLPQQPGIILDTLLGVVEDLVQVFLWYCCHLCCFFVKISKWTSIFVHRYMHLENFIVLLFPRLAFVVHWAAENLYHNDTVCFVGR